MQNSVPGFSFATWRVILSHIVHNFGMLRRTTSTEGMTKLYQASKPAESRRKEKLQDMATKKMQAVLEEMSELEPGTVANDFKIDYQAAARDALNRFQKELATREIEQTVKHELGNGELKISPPPLRQRR